MILLVDADSLIFASCYRAKNDVNYELYPDNFYTDIKIQLINLMSSL